MSATVKYVNTKIFGRSVTLSLPSRSLALLDQYRKKSMEFQTNNLLVPIGGDFEWQTQWEWTGAVKNLRTAIDYFNSNLELFAEVTLHSYDFLQFLRLCE